MMNQVVLVGRVVSLPVVNEEGRRATLKIAVQRNYKNADGIYETDFIDCVLWNDLMNSAVEYLKVGDIIGIKGRLQSDEGATKVISEKVTFLSAKSSNERSDD